MNNNDWEESVVDVRPVKGSRWVKCVAEIRLNETGEIREVTTDELLDDGCEFPCSFGWSDGNFSCDCNRRIFFDEDDEDDTCSDGQYSVNLKNAKTGEVYYREFGGE